MKRFFEVKLSKINLIFFLTSGLVLIPEVALAKFNISGNKKIDSKTIEYNLKDLAKNINPDTENEVIKTLYSTKFFNQISTSRSGSDISIMVEENPIIQSVEINGISKNKSKDLLKSLSCSKGQILIPESLEIDLFRLKMRNIMSGKFLTQVSYKIKKLPNNTVKLDFFINESRNIPIRNITITGANTKAIRYSTLKRVLSTKESRSFNKFFGQTFYQPSGSIQQDISNIKHLYYSKGFVDADVDTPITKLSKDRRGFEVIYNLKEGPQYRFNDIKLINNTDVKIDLNKNWIKKGKVFDINKVEGVSEHISEVLSKNGYPEVKIFPDLKKDFNNKKIDIDFIVENAKKHYIGNVNVINNAKTQTAFILRQMRIGEGDSYNQKKINLGIHKLHRLDYFHKVVPIKKVREDGKIDLIIDVDEKSTASGRSGISFSEGTQNVFLKLIERNVIGTGIGFSFQVDINASKNIESSIEISYPNLFGQDLFGKASASLSNSNFSKGNKLLDAIGITKEELYNKQTSKINGSISYNLSDQVSHSLGYERKYENLNLSNNESKEIESLGEVVVLNEIGEYFTSSINNKFQFDLASDDPNFDRLSLLTISNEIAGLGGTSKFVKNELEYKYMFPVGEESLIKIKASAGHINAFGGYKLRSDERFSSSSSKLRGFAQAGIGPRIDPSLVLKKIEKDEKIVLSKDKELKQVDKEKIKKQKLSDGRSLGGEYYYYGTLQYETPFLSSEIFQTKISAFVDSGSVFSVNNSLYKDLYIEHKDPRLSIGVGFSLEFNTIPIPPLTLDLAYPIRKLEEDNPQYFHFSLSGETKF